MAVRPAKVGVAARRRRHRDACRCRSHRLGSALPGHQWHLLEHGLRRLRPGAHLSWPSSEFTGGAHAAPPSAETSPAPEDPLDRIAKLARLRDTGALTNEEFEREKAKLLAQM